VIAINEKEFFGLLIGDEMVELLLNEGCPQFFEVIQREDFKEAITNSSRIWGNRELMLFT
jgi:hypothetical protein